MTTDDIRALLNHVNAQTFNGKPAGTLLFCRFAFSAGEPTLPPIIFLAENVNGWNRVWDGTRWGLVRDEHGKTIYPEADFPVWLGVAMTKHAHVPLPKFDKPVQCFEAMGRLWEFVEG